MSLPFSSKSKTEYDGNKKDINTIEIANSLILGSHCTINKNNLYNNKDNKSNAGISILQNRKDASMSTNSNELEDQEEEMSRLEKYRNQLWKNSSAARTIISTIDLNQNDRTNCTARTIRRWYNNGVHSYKRPKAIITRSPHDDASYSRRPRKCTKIKS